MAIDDEEKLWTRECPKCKNVVEHKSRAKRNFSQKHNKPCAACSRKNTGKKNAMTDACPVCAKNIRIPVADTSEAEAHAAEHGLTQEGLWLKKHGSQPQLCKCGCGGTTRWVGWWKGYSTFINGHNGNIYSSYSEQTAKQIAETRSQSLAGRPGWAAGLTKEQDERIRLRGEAISRSLKRTHERIRAEDCLIGNLKSVPTRGETREQITAWIEGLIGLDVGKNVRGIISNGELDIYVPSHQFAIELGGTHEGKKHNYYQKKAEACKNVGIKLFHIFEDEWLEKRDIVESMIAVRLNEVSAKVMARKCQIIELTPRERREFFTQNHIDGDVQATKAWGLTFNNELVSALSVRHPFHKQHKKDAFEVGRFCSRKNLIAIGGMSKLTAQAVEFAREKNKAKIITYVDDRFGGNDAAYEIAGFQKISTTPPRFWWTDGRRRYNRFKFRADKSRDMSEAQVAEEAGVTKIWGCSNRLYEMRC